MTPLSIATDLEKALVDLLIVADKGDVLDIFWRSVPAGRTGARRATCSYDCETTKRRY
jgi:hypothetical protein